MKAYNDDPENKKRRKALRDRPEARKARADRYALNREQNAARAKTYNARPEVKERSNKRQKLARMNALGRAQALVRSAKSRASKEGMDFDLDATELAYVIEHCMCPYILQPFILTEGRHPWAPSLDRTDNEKGYTKDNVQVVSLWWNIAKNEWPSDITVAALQGLKRALQDMIFE